MNKFGTILVVDDDPMVLETLREMFIDDYDVEAVDSGSAAIDLIKSNGRFDAVILDIKMSQMDGLATAERIGSLDKTLPILFHTGYPGDYSEREIDEKYKPFDYLVKGEKPDRLYRMVHNAVQTRKLRRNTASLIKQARAKHGLVGGSLLMQEVYRQIELIAPKSGNVLITGPTGTGKELVAQALYKLSPRSERPFAVFNCNHKNPELVESALFGHKKGAFTGAYNDQIGLFELADGGTILFDEIGDISAATQNKLLRTLDNGEIAPLGSSQNIKVDVRMFYATNKNLEQLLDKELIREDFYYRIKGINIELPALKDRREDINDLVGYFAEEYCLANHIGLKIFSKDAIKTMLDYDWPGNIRELKRMVEALIDTVESYFIKAGQVGNYLKLSESEIISEKSYQALLKKAKETIITGALIDNDNNVNCTAQQLKMDKANLYRMIKDIGLQYRQDDNE